jgi:hypothetical protein
VQLRAPLGRRSPSWIAQWHRTSGLTVKATPPFSLLGPEPRHWDYTLLEPAERYKFAEFHKWKFTTQWYTKLTRSKSGHDFVLMARAGLRLPGPVQ